MALLPGMYCVARHTARFHLQVQLQNVPSDVPTPDAVVVEGKVVRVFRGRKALGVGDIVTFKVMVTRRTDDIDSIPIGPPLWDYDYLLKVKFMEVFLNGEPPACGLAAWQAQFVEAPSVRPIMQGKHLRCFLAWRLTRLSKIGRASCRERV